LIDGMQHVVADFEQKASRARSIAKIEALAEAARKSIHRITKQGRYTLEERIRDSRKTAPPWAIEWSTPPTHLPKLKAKLAAAEGIALERIDEIVERRRQEIPRR
jgi:hypothetical protein